MDNEPISISSSILLSVKKLIGIDENYNDFDIDLIMHINSVIATLRQLGIGPLNGYSITGNSETWSDLLGEDEKMLESVKTYMYFKVKCAFASNQYIENVKLGKCRRLNRHNIFSQSNIHKSGT